MLKLLIALLAAVACPTSKSVCASTYQVDGGINSFGADSPFGVSVPTIVNLTFFIDTSVAPVVVMPRTIDLRWPYERGPFCCSNFEFLF